MSLACDSRCDTLPLRLSPENKYCVTMPLSLVFYLVADLCSIFVSVNASEIVFLGEALNQEGGIYFLERF